MATGTSGVREAVQRWRLVLRRGVLPDDQVQRSQLADWEAALVASGLPVAGLDAPRPKPRFAQAVPLAPAIPGEAELLDVWLVERLARWRVRESLVAVMPAGHEVVDLYDVWLGEPALPGRVAASVFRATFPPGQVRAEATRQAAASLLAAATLPRERRKGETTVAYDLRPFLGAVEVTEAPDGSTTIRMTLRHDPERGLGRPDEALAALGEALGGAPLGPVALVRESIVLADPPVVEPAAGRGPRRAPGADAERVDRPRRPSRAP